MRYVVAVAEERNFTRAAARCFVTQSALSHQVAALEREIGTALFARTSRRVELTAAGESFVAAARRCLDQAARAVSEAVAAAGQVRGTVRVGAIPTVSAVDLPSLLTDFARAYPEVRVRVRLGHSQELTEQVLAGNLEMAFLGLPQDAAPAPGLATRALGQERLALYVPTTHPVAKRSHVDLADVAGEQWVDFPARTQGRRQSDLAFEVAGLDRTVGTEAESPEFLLALVARGHAMTVLPYGLPRPDGVTTLAINDAPLRNQFLVWDDFNLAPSGRAFLAAVAQTGRP